MWRVAVLAILVGIGLTARASAQDTPRLISVTGEGQVEVAPDMAIITLGVTHEAKNAQDAMAEVSKAVTGILTRLGETGIENRDIQTSRFSLNPVWSNRNSSNGNRAEITGFSASNAVSVRVRDLSVLGAVLTQVVQDGANDFNGLQFALQDPEPLMETARTRAVQDAMAKAQQMAAAAGVTLGAVQSIAEHSGRNQPVMMERAMMSDSSIPIAEGEVSISASVSMEFAIEN
ncbi:hypothetical protein C1J05_14315 [Sulfitobacter sp. JL08]|uniref:SIMPL domain-containing protein n=1 Tax=Sulfitobacter sp. JL08 TaxID=2070369 RepID=UPI000E0B1199|nr:SIMPL domain-containing protein [Sulfitobacter sp. JL08]AXI55525.1 hypothetical protein C1J05_14315 [Sulfitobacter sp. JL08]